MVLWGSFRAAPETGGRFWPRVSPCSPQVSKAQHVYSCKGVRSPSKASPRGLCCLNSIQSGFGARDLKRRHRHCVGRFPRAFSRAVGTAAAPLDQAGGKEHEERPPAPGSPPGVRGHRSGERKGKLMASTGLPATAPGRKPVKHSSTSDVGCPEENPTQPHTAGCRLAGGLFSTPRC